MQKQVKIFNINAVDIQHIFLLWEILHFIVSHIDVIIFVKKNNHNINRN